MSSQRKLTVRPDAKGRITLGSLANGISSYQVVEQPDGRLILEPYKEIPAREAWLFENPIALQSVRKGLEDAAKGNTRKRGDFSKFAEGGD